MEEILRGLAAVVVLGIAAQWIAWRFRLPSILLLILVGFFAGPEWSGIVDPTAMFQQSLFPIVSCSVAIILFEGGLTLKVRELGEYGSVVRKLVSLGAAITWVLAGGAAYLLLDLELPIAILFGAILTVTGPTVVGPLLRQIRPTGAAGSILKWEGIVIDPVGAVLAILVLEAVLAGGLTEGTRLTILGIVETVCVGLFLGVAGAWVLLIMLRRYWVPDHLHNPTALGIVLLVFWGANAIHNEAGLVSVTLMGVVLGNQGRVPIRHILEFKENLRVLLISALFILMAARLRIEDLKQFDWGMVAFLSILIFIVRPLGVFVCTKGAGLSIRERVFMSWMAPRGIVAAAVASVFAFRLEQEGVSDAARLVPMTFLVILGTVVVYGLTAGPLAQRLGLSSAHPQGVMTLGAHAWGRALALALQDAGLRVLVVDANPSHIAQARMDGLKVYFGNVLADNADEELDLQGIGRLFALTPNDEVNALCAIHYRHLFGSSEVYQLTPAKEIIRGTEPVPTHMRGRSLFGEEIHHDVLAARFRLGAVMKTTPLTEQFDFAAWRSHYGEGAIPLLTIDESGAVTVATVNRPLQPQSGQTLVALVDEPKG